MSPRNKQAKVGVGNIYRQMRGIKMREHMIYRYKRLILRPRKRFYKT